MKKPYLASYVEEHMLNLLEKKIESSSTIITETVEESDSDEFRVINLKESSILTFTIEDSDPDEFNSFYTGSTKVTDTVENSDPDEFELLAFNTNTQNTRSLENSDPDEFGIENFNHNSKLTKHLKPVTQTSLISSIDRITRGKKLMENELKLGIGIQYYSGLFDESLNQEYIEKFEEYEIQYNSFDKSTTIFNSIELLDNAITILFTPDLINSLANSLVTNGLYDLIKNYIIWLSQSIKGKKMKKMNGQKTVEEIVTIGIKIQINKNLNINFRIDEGFSNETKAECLNKIFELQRNFPDNIKFGHYIGMYNEKGKKWDLINIVDIIKKPKVK